MSYGADAAGRQPFLPRSGTAWERKVGRYHVATAGLSCAPIPQPPVPIMMTRFVLVLLATCAAAHSQSQLTPLTSSVTSHGDIKMSPNGSLIAFRVGTTSLGIVTAQSGTETILYTSTANAITSYVWDRFGQSLLFVEQDQLRVVARTGGAPLTLATGLGSNVAVWCTDGTDVFCTRQPSPTTTEVVRASATGTGQPAGIATYLGAADQLALSPNRRFLLVRTTSGQPFAPPVYERLDLQTNATTPIATLTDPAESGVWLDDGQNFVCATRSPTFAQPQIARVDASGVVTFLTDRPALHRRPVVAPNGRWIVFETQAPTGLGTTVGLLPTDGGGIVFVDAGRQLLVNLGQTTGGLAIDSTETRIALGASSSVGGTAQVYTAAIADEVRVSPRLQTGSSFSIQLPVPAGRIGIVAVSFGLGPGVPLPPLGGQIWLDVTPGNATSVLIGIGGGGPATANFAVPAQPGLVGLRLYFQGAHFDAAFQGAFTRFGTYRVF